MEMIGGGQIGRAQLLCWCGHQLEDYCAVWLWRDEHEVMSPITGVTVMLKK